MVLDKEDHRAILLELIDKAMFNGAALDAVLELREAIRNAKIADAKNATRPTAGRAERVLNP